ncbi:MAG: ParB/RepB/Spo0J family partition protein [Defluviitaleaceae bacterium]|nr:ParB/RepB/Spo0J family partition protein [Defluviitaleaceae bacterium]
MKKGLTKGLGKGLDALIKYSSESTESNIEIIEADIASVFPNKDQPRKFFKTPEIEELSASIKEFGIIQPLVVKRNDNDTYTIIAGERRFRAAKQAGLETVPVIVRDYSDLEILGIALIENIQREDLNPIEEAMCYKRLNEEFGMIQEEIAKKIGKSRSHISNCIRVLKLDDVVLELISSEKLTMGHAKAILSADDKETQVYFAQKMLEEGMNVRQAEEFVRNYNTEETAVETEKKATPKKAAKEIYVNYQVDLRGVLGTRVNIKDTKTDGSSGKIEINYFSQEDLQRIVDIIKNRR